MRVLRSAPAVASRRQRIWPHLKWASTCAAGAVILAGSVAPALAHTGAGTVDGLLSGLAHPFLGLDHVLAMTLVGLWAARIGGRALLLWPASFLVMVLIGGMTGLAGLPLPGVESVIALSVILLGLAVALGLPVPASLGALICGTFALFHGHAHGSELPAGAGAFAYSAGFLIATALLHGAGLFLGTAAGLARLPWLLRSAGGAAAVAGMLLLTA